jgi:hypothetical protein
MFKRHGLTIPRSGLIRTQPTLAQSPRVRPNHRSSSRLTRLSTPLAHTDGEHKSLSLVAEDFPHTAAVHCSSSSSREVHQAHQPAALRVQVQVLGAVRQAHQHFPDLFANSLSHRDHHLGLTILRSSVIVRFYQASLG